MSPLTKQCWTGHALFMKKTSDPGQKHITLTAIFIHVFVLVITVVLKARLCSQFRNEKNSLFEQSQITNNNRTEISIASLGLLR